MRSQPASYHGYRFPPDIISHAVWLYHRFCLSFRDAEDLLAQRGVTVTYETIRQWCQRFGPVYARQLRRRRGRMGDTWHLDEVFVTIQGRRQYLWRAVDEDGDVLDILVQPRRIGTPRSLLSQVAEEPAASAATPDHRQAAQLLGRLSRGDAVGGPRHRSVREQSSRGLPPTDASAGAPDAAVHVGRSAPTVRVGSRYRAESLPSRSTPPAVGSPPPAPHPCVR